MGVGQLVLDDGDAGHEGIDAGRLADGQVVSGRRDELRISRDDQRVLELLDVFGGQLRDRLDQLAALQEPVESRRVGGLHSPSALILPAGPTGTCRAGQRPEWPECRSLLRLARATTLLPRRSHLSEARRDNPVPEERIRRRVAGAQRRLGSADGAAKERNRLGSDQRPEWPECRSLLRLARATTLLPRRSPLSEARTDNPVPEERIRRRVAGAQRRLGSADGAAKERNRLGSDQRPEWPECRSLLRLARATT